MRVLLLSPTTLPTVTGNALTTERWRRSLEQLGVSVLTLSSRGQTVASLKEAIDHFQPVIIHAHHAFQSGCRLLELSALGAGEGIPFVVSPAGTDINRDLEVAPRREVIAWVSRRARAIIAQGPGTLERLEEILPECGDRLFPVPKAIMWLGNDHFPLREAAGCAPGDVLFLQPAGVRPVKGNLECLKAMELVRELRPQVRVIFCGPELDPIYAARFAEAVHRSPGFAHWIPLVPPQAMRSVYEQADVVVNASFSEGLSNALLEGMACGLPLLASDIIGNRGPVSGEQGEAPAGLLFDPRNPREFIYQAVRLLDDASLRHSLAQAGKRRAAAWPTPAEEARGLLTAYEFACQ